MHNTTDDKTVTQPGTPLRPTLSHSPALPTATVKEMQFVVMATRTSLIKLRESFDTFLVSEQFYVF